MSETLSFRSAGGKKISLVFPVSGDAVYTFPPAGQTIDYRTIRLTANRTTTSTTLGNITDLSFSIAPGETWMFEAYLRAGCNNTGGSQFSVTTPTGAVINCTIQGRGGSATAINSGAVAASAGAGPTVNNFNDANGWVQIRGIVVNGSTAGSLQLQFKSVTNGQTTTVYENSVLAATRI